MLKGNSRVRAVLFLFILALIIRGFAPAALAGDEATLDDLPGRWSNEDIAEEEDWEPVVLVLEENGSLSLACPGADGASEKVYGGTWSFLYKPDENDLLTLLFTDAGAGDGQAAECVYEVYTESWVEDNKEITYLILTTVSVSGVSPFESAFGDYGPTLYREQGPNMRVVRCKEFVSLREEPSTKSARVVKVPLGAMVFGYGETDGFTFCIYQEEEQSGYILSEYLERVE